MKWVNYPYDFFKISINLELLIKKNFHITRAIISFIFKITSLELINYLKKCALQKVVHCFLGYNVGNMLKMVKMESQILKNNNFINI